MTKEQFLDSVNFGTTQGESFEKYIIRVGEHITDYKAQFGVISTGLQMVIIDIFKTSCLHKTNGTSNDIVKLVTLLKQELNKPYTKQIEDVNTSK